MNLFVADPEWGWWIILYFFLGGVAAGAYFTATLIELFGRSSDSELSRAGYRIAFPLIVLCGLFLIIDLHRPERFWHMLLKSEIVNLAFSEGWPLTARSWSLMAQAPLLKYWSPMSIGSWAFSLFGLCSFLSFLGTLWPEGRLGRILNRTVIKRCLSVVGCLVGFFVAAYTGALLSATNQPIWSDTVWLAPLFLTSAASTGIATMILLLHWQGHVRVDAQDRLEQADTWVMFLELAVFVGFLASLGSGFELLIQTLGGIVCVVGTLLLGLLTPLAIHLGLGRQLPHSGVTAAAFALVGGFFLRYGLLTASPELLKNGPALVAGFGPEDGRSRGGGRGADPGNSIEPLEPRSKVFHNP